MPEPAVPPTPPVPLSALLAREDLALRRIAGPADADTVIHWAHTSEMADPFPYLLGGELLLTAGVHVPEAAGSGTYFDDYVSRIVEAGGAALGFGLAPVHDTVPRALVAACDAYGLPLLEVPPQTTFSGVARAVWQLMAQARHAELRRVTEAQQSLAAAASRPDPVPAVLRQLAQRVGGWAVLYGPEGAVIGETGRSAPGTAVRAALAELAGVVRPVVPAAGGESARQPSGPQTPAYPQPTSAVTGPESARPAGGAHTTRPATGAQATRPTGIPGAARAGSSPQAARATTHPQPPTTDPDPARPATGPHTTRPATGPQAARVTAGPQTTRPAGAPGAARAGSRGPAGQAARFEAPRPSAGSAATPSSASDTIAGTHLSAYALGSGQGFVLGVAAARRDSGDHTIASVAAVLLSLLTGEQQSGSGAARSSALVRMLLGAEPEAVAPLLGAEHWLVVHGSPDTQPCDPVAASALGAALGSPLVDLAPDVVRVLAPADREPAPQPGWTLGVSAPATAPDWPAADTQAARALSRARATRTPLFRHGTQRPALTDLLAPDEAEAHARDLLAPLTAPLTETLRTWLSLHGSWDRTAVALSVHRNTVRQRIARCATLLETDLDDPDVRMELWFALRRIEP
ncbi:PucR family transcriptional regulator ligand-binding domain-containing protein [Streptomyces sp. NBC_01017]|uniref:PucR family transcriptional regulator ligand-binding domain-containing protein n=1 Tax=Streptomyces sp. NBC_01017 TaxID=2903721 RepID=UPI0038650066|nr:PucR family transcriptional regulator ligand-binding domain-containing protein [Streptomyces sp. NBC_01017]